MARIAFSQPAVRTAPVDAFAWTLLVLLPLSYLWLWQLGDERAPRLAAEDGPIENLGALFFLLAALTLLYTYVGSLTRRHQVFGLSMRGDIYLLLLALFFVLCFGEEISWGQRIFGWESGDWWQSNNAQKETNLHNLWAFQVRSPDVSEKSFLGRFLNANFVLSLFWLLYCVCLPLAWRLSKWARGLVEFAGVPVPPLIVGAVFVVSYVAFRGVVSFGDLDRSMVSALDELKEATYGIVFFVLALYFGAMARRQALAS